MAALGGLGLAVALAYPGPDQVVESVKDFPSRVAYGVALPFNQDELRRARDERFADERFTAYPQELAVAGDLRASAGLSGDSDIFVLGDSQVLYTLLQQRPPWHIVPYNSSPLNDQRRIIEELEEASPSVVVVDRTSQVFDGVPHDVRIPLIFQYVIDNYEFDHAVGPYDILVRRAPDFDKSAQYWSELLGQDIELGSTPNVSSYDDPEPCRPVTDACGAFLVVERERTGTAGTVDVLLEFGGYPIVVQFTSEEASRYTLPLARTWPWALSSDVQVARSLTDGWRARIVPGLQPDGTLY